MINFKVKCGKHWTTPKKCPNSSNGQHVCVRSQGHKTGIHDGRDYGHCTCACYEEKVN